MAVTYGYNLMAVNQTSGCKLINGHNLSNHGCQWFIQPSLLIACAVVNFYIRGTNTSI